MNNKERYEKLKTEAIEFGGLLPDITDYVEELETRASTNAGSQYQACERCDGRGKLRDNRTVDGKYILGFTTCYRCNGSGEEPSVYELANRKIPIEEWGDMSGLKETLETNQEYGDNMVRLALISFREYIRKNGKA